MVSADLERSMASTQESWASGGATDWRNRMTDISVATRSDMESVVAYAGPTQNRDVFLPRESGGAPCWSSLWRRHRWPLGIYTTPVLIVVIW